jgi:YVTN family beta-propeller protein
MRKGRPALYMAAVTGVAISALLLIGGLALPGGTSVSLLASVTESGHHRSVEVPISAGPFDRRLFAQGTTSLGTPGDPLQMAYDNRSGTTFVASDPSWVTVLKGTPPKVVDSIYLGNNTYPESIVYDSGNNTVFVGTSPGNLLVISAQSYSIEANLSVGYQAISMTYDAGTGEVYAGMGLQSIFAKGTTSGDYNVTVINGTNYNISEIATYPQIPVIYPSHVEIDSATGDLIAMGEAGAEPTSSVAAFDPTTGEAVWDDPPYELLSGPAYAGIALDPVNQRIYLANCVNETVSVLDASSGIQVAQIPFPTVDGVCGFDGFLSYDPSTGNVLIGTTQEALRVLNPTNNSLSNLTFTGGSPVGSVYVGASGTAWVLNYDTSSVAILASNDSAMQSLTSIGGGPTAIAVDTTDGMIYAADSDNVSVVNATSHHLLGTVPVGYAPGDILFDPMTDDLFISNTNSDNVSVLSAASNTVVASIPVDPYPWGLTWDNTTDTVYVACMNLTLGEGYIDAISPTTLTVTARFSQGPFSYPDGVVFDPHLSELFVSHSFQQYAPYNLSIISPATGQFLGSVPLPVVPAPGQMVYDNVTGLIYVPGAGYAYSINQGDYVVNPVNQSVVGYLPVGAVPIGLATDPGSGSVFVDAMANDTLTALDGQIPSERATVALPPSSEPEGIALDQMSGQAVVADSGTDALSYFSYANVYEVVFDEAGLPLGTNWSVTVNGSTNGSSGDSVTFGERNGNYSFTVSAIVGYTITPPTGYVTVNGTNVTVAVQFTPTPPETYSVNFSESGLPSGANWSVTLNGTTELSGRSEIQFDEPNGSYPFAVGLSAAYAPSPGSGTVNVSGKPVNETITFSSICYGLSCPGKYLVVFTESGLPSGTMWSLTINGSIVSGTTSVLLTRLQNGTHPFSVGQVTGYIVNPQTGSVSVNGSGLDEDITFTPTTSPTPAFWGLSDVDWYILVGAAVGAAVVGIVVAVARHRRGGGATPKVAATAEPNQGP